MLAMLAKAKLTMDFNAHVIRDQEKALVFCQLPATTILIIAALRLIGVDDSTLGALMKPEEREAVITAFTEKDDGAMVLVVIYAVGTAGLNLQHECWRVHQLESAHISGIHEEHLLHTFLHMHSSEAQFSTHFLKCSYSTGNFFHIHYYIYTRACWYLQTNNQGPRILCVP